MTEQVVKTLTDPSFLIAMLVGIAVFATVFTLMPAFGGTSLKSRMKSVALERDKLRAEQRARLASEADRRRKGLREEQSIGMRNVVDRLDLRRALADENTIQKLKVAGFRGENPLTRFLFFRLVLPFAGFALAAIYLFVLGGLPQQPTFIRLFVCVVVAYGGFYAPIVYVNNRATKRKQSIQLAWPDALDLMLICVESGMSVEAALRRVADEIGAQSVALAEEFVLTNAELSYLQDRKTAYENLASRTGLESVKSVSQALVQAERYGTPVAHALRVLASESRDMRMNAAEKKAAALPPKLTVPMILFFLPVLFAIILGPAGIQVSQRGIFGDQHSSSSQ
ncbi:type II secretion system F family protein [Mesorhizobium sp. B4-1-3]|uniref:type II secretion system F family protein n=1 Tax=Mesorhizobium sp. B4-1-3 TaxID=2589889 RepID=UPI001128542C|nr:type II secretion system F family protein [Mesorhizobium sp. B4-1-3]TPI14945.1 type II secretion system F family protein [Mesorhizobium sp. B4-1-3]